MKSSARPCSRRPHSSSRPRVGGLRVRGGLRRPPARDLRRKNARRAAGGCRGGGERSAPSRVTADQRPDCAEPERGRERGERQKARDDHERRLPVRSSRLMRSQRRSGPRSDEGGVRVVATVRPRVGGKNEDGAIFAASWVAARPARVRRRRLPDTSATRPHATRVPLLRARVAPRPDAAAKRTGGEATHRASLPKPARDVPERIRASLADPSRPPDPRLEAVRGTCHAVRRSEGTSLTSAPNAREWKCRGSRSRAPKVARPCFRFLGCRDTNRRAEPRARKRLVRNVRLVTTEPRCCPATRR